MRMSCNGCRVLRKGCSDDCTLRPCLQWIKNSDSQGNATLFLAKFYGRAGLMNLINGGPEHLRPAIFRSLLYEACGRIVNPIYGSAGLLWSGSWQLCQAAVEAVLSGGPIVQVSSESDDASNVSPPLKACDIRHVFKVDKSAEAASHELHKVKTRKRSKRSAATLKVIKDELDESGVSEQPVQGGETDSMSVETEEASLVEKHEERTGDEDLDLELTLGFESVRKAKKACLVKGGDGINGSGSGTSELLLGL